MMKAGLIEEMMEDAMNDAMDTEGLEEETEEEVARVLEEVAGETLAALPAAVSGAIALVCPRAGGCLGGRALDESNLFVVLAHWLLHLYLLSVDLVAGCTTVVAAGTQSMQHVFVRGCRSVRGWCGRCRLPRRRKTMQQS